MRPSARRPGRRAADEDLDPQAVEAEEEVEEETGEPGSETMEA